MFGAKISIDLGTANIVFVDENLDIILDEPSVVAFQTVKGARRVLAVGHDAKLMLGKTPESIQAIRPMSDGVIADFEAAQQMIGTFFRKALNRFSFGRPTVYVCVPYGATPVEKRAIMQSVIAAGARQVGLVEEPMAAALGAGLSVLEPRGSLVVDIGGGTTEVAVVSLGGIVDAKSIRVGGDHFDSAIQAFVKKKFNLNVGLPQCEKIKLEIGSAINVDQSVKKAPIAKLSGRDSFTGLPESHVVTANDVAEALSPLIEQIWNAVSDLLDKTPPDLAADIYQDGIMLTGGGALLHGLDERLKSLIGVPVSIAENPKYCVAFGTQIAMNMGKKMAHAVLRDI